jgi:glycine/D-amino acid oxidase-like deaminating enzyme
LYRQSVLGVTAVLRLADRYAPAAVTPCQGQLVVGFTGSEQADVLRDAYAYRELGLDVALVAAGSRAAPAAGTNVALHFPGAAGVDPRELTIGLARAATALGVEVSNDTPVIGLSPEGGGLTTVHTGRGALRARAAVVTVDSAAPDLLPPAGDQIELEVCAQATAVLRSDLLAELGGPSAPHVVSASPLGAYRRITPGGRLVIGGGPATVLPARRGSRQSQRRERAWAWQRLWLSRVHADLRHVEVEYRWSGSITVTRDGLPVLARADLPGEVWHASGWNGHGLAATVLAGDRLASSVLREDREPAAEPTLLWRPPRPWPLARPAARPVVQAYLDAIAPKPVPAARRTDRPRRAAPVLQELGAA